MHNKNLGACVFAVLTTDVRVHQVFVARESMTVSRHVAHCRAADRRNGFVIDRYGNVTPWRDATRYTRLGCILHAGHSGGSRHRSASRRSLQERWILDMDSTWFNILVHYGVQSALRSYR